MHIVGFEPTMSLLAEMDYESSAFDHSAIYASVSNLRYLHPLQGL